eukprot:116741_1
MSLLFNRKFSRVHKNLRISPRALGVALRVLVDRIRAGKTGYISAPLDQAIDAIHGHLSPDTPYLIDSVGGIISCCGIAGSEKVEQFEKVAYVPRMLVHAMIEYDKDWSLFDASETWIWILKRCVNRVLAQLNSYAAQNNQRRRYSLYDESQPQQPRVPYSQSQQRRPQQPPVPYSQSQQPRRQSQRQPRRQSEQPRRQSQRQCADDDRKCADDDWRLSGCTCATEATEISLYDTTGTVFVDSCLGSMRVVVAVDLDFLFLLRVVVGLVTLVVQSNVIRSAV